MIAAGDRVTLQLAKGQRVISVRTKAIHRYRCSSNSHPGAAHHGEHLGEYQVAQPKLPLQLMVVISCDYTARL